MAHLDTLIIYLDVFGNELMHFILSMIFGTSKKVFDWPPNQMN